MQSMVGQAACSRKGWGDACELGVGFLAGALPPGAADGATIEGRCEYIPGALAPTLGCQLNPDQIDDLLAQGEDAAADEDADGGRAGRSGPLASPLLVDDDDEDYAAPGLGAYAPDLRIPATPPVDAGAVEAALAAEAEAEAGPGRAAGRGPGGFPALGGPGRPLPRLPRLPGGLLGATAPGPRSPAPGGAETVVNVPTTVENSTALSEGAVVVADDDCSYEHQWICGSQALYQQAFFGTTNVTDSEQEEKCLAEYADVQREYPDPPEMTVQAGNQSVCVSLSASAYGGNNCMNQTATIVNYLIEVRWNRTNPGIPVNTEMLLGEPKDTMPSYMSVILSKSVLPSDFEAEGEVLHEYMSGLMNGVHYLVTAQAISDQNQVSALTPANMKQVVPRLDLGEPEQCIVSPDLSNGFIGSMAILCIFALLFVWIAVTVLVMRRRFLGHQKRMQEHAERLLLTSNLQTISGSKGGEVDGKWLFHEVLNADAPRQLVYVFTDVQSSTLLSTSDPQAFNEMQHAHDHIMREYITLCNGYEIDTEGDAFRCVFPTVSEALRFCASVQEELLWYPWSAQVLDQAPARAEANRHGELVFAGPRIRMGVHLARPDEYAVAMHPLTKRVVFSGPAFALAKALGDCAWGGQILVTEACLREGDRDALTVPQSRSYPVFEDLGEFKLRGPADQPTRVFQASPTFWITSTPTETHSDSPDGKEGSLTLSWVQSCFRYSARSAMGLFKHKEELPPLQWPKRDFGPIRCPRHTKEGLGRHWFSVPTTNAFIVSMRFSGLRLDDLLDADVPVFSPEFKRTAAHLARSPTMDPAGRSPSRSGALASKALREQAGQQAVERIVCQLLNLYCGFTVRSHDGLVTSEDDPSFMMAAFTTNSAAIRFALSLQIALLTATWPDHVLKQPEHETVRGADGHILYRGVRCATSINLCRCLDFEDPAATPLHQSTTLAETVIGVSPRPDADRSPAPGGRVVDKSVGSRRGFEALMLTMDALGDGVAELNLCYSLCHAAHYGQIVVGERAWQDLNRSTVITIPGNPRLTHLGTHCLGIDQFSSSIELMELTPRQLLGRTWPAPNTLELIEPGARQAPGYAEFQMYQDVTPKVALCFTTLVAPDERVRLSKAGARAYDDAVVELSAAAKQLIRRFGGYFCQEVDPGFFMIAFADIREAIMFASRLQLFSLEQPYSAALPRPEKLYPDEFTYYPDVPSAERSMNAMGPIRVTVGISHGSPSRLSIHPTTGRADYFGSVVNLSARLASAAHGGQILLEGSPSIDFVENDLAREVDFMLLVSTCGRRTGRR